MNVLPPMIAGHRVKAFLNTKKKLPLVNPIIPHNRPTRRARTWRFSHYTELGVVFTRSDGTSIFRGSVEHGWTPTDIATFNVLLRERRERRL